MGLSSTDMLMERRNLLPFYEIGVSEDTIHTLKNKLTKIFHKVGFTVNIGVFANHHFHFSSFSLWFVEQSYSQKAYLVRITCIKGINNRATTIGSKESD